MHVTSSEGKGRMDASKRHSIALALGYGADPDLFIDGNSCPLYPLTDWQVDIRAAALQLGSALAQGARDTDWMIR